MLASSTIQPTRFALICKSYRNDVLRAKRLLASVVQFNTESLPFYFITPEADKDLFFETLGLPQSKGYQWVSDETIANAHPRATASELQKYSGYITQQVVKSDFWRLGLCDAFLCLDSDAQFIRPFGLADFVHPDSNPYTVMHNCAYLLDGARQRGQQDVLDNFANDSAMIKTEFGRSGADYDFGPVPMLWSAKVWQWLDAWLAAKGETLWTAVARKPSEIRWYGEALLASQCMPIHAITPLFRFYHYDWEYLADQANGINEQVLAQNYLGVVYQSNWEEALTPQFAQKSWASRTWRHIKAKLRGH